ncbi:MAG: hypothetical protein G01um101444_248 [Parcubacteria group bacterium Gr01-1014_44]|nr:MAG: hypothetical protein G01um101444_248 [Parcubacteria group bacterium Gr01-1014_44]
MEIKEFSLPEQLAINEILHLINEKKVKFINMVFFSEVSSTPLRRISANSTELFTFPPSPFPLLFVQTEVFLFVRGKKVAKVVVQGQLELAKIPGVRDDLLNSWRASSVKALKKYWRGDSGESKEFTEFNPQHGPGFYPTLSSKKMWEYENELRKFFD